MKILPLLSAILALAACSRPTALTRLGADEATAREAIAEFVARGEAALPELKGAATHEDPLVRRRAKTAIGRITGQWGSDHALRWKRSLDEAKDKGRPILVLQLFGKFDEEFC
jgi:hypothetical protein